MPEERIRAAWEEIEGIVAQGDADALSTYLDTLTPAQVARAISRLDESAQTSVLTLLEPEDAADLLEELSDAQSADILEEIPAPQAAAIVDEMESDERADVLAELDTDDAEAILRQMDPEEAAETRQLLSYPSDTAGGIMVTEFLSYPMDARVSDVIADIRKNAEEYADYSAQYAYVLSSAGTLVGVLPLKDLLLAPSGSPLTAVMIPNPIYALATSSLEDLEQLFDRYTFFVVPVVDEAGRLAGVVLRGDAEQALGERADKALMRFSGIVGGDELRTMPLFHRSFRRLSWLCINLVLTMAAAAVIKFFEDVVSQIIALAFFIPVIGNMSGCSGNQAVGVSIRELSLGVITPEDFVRVMLKELQMGLINGVLLGAALGLAAFALEGSVALGLVVGGALALNSVIALSLGGLVPLVLRKLNADPALSAPLIVTSVSDMFGFLILLTLAMCFREQITEIL
jgi:magnesium transporter